MGESHEILGGKVRVYRREHSGYWQCSLMLDGKRVRASTKNDSLALAKEFAEDWYFRMRTGEAPTVRKPKGKTFKDAAEKFLIEFPIITEGQRNAIYVKGKEITVRLHLMPFFGKMELSDITPGLITEYRMHRMQERARGDKPPARSTLHREIVALRQVLKTAHRHGWLSVLPDMTAPYKSSGKVTHRAWFSPAE